MAPAGPLFIIGTGPLISTSTATLFASHSFTTIALFSRTAATLSAASTSIKTTAPSTNISTYEVDVTSPSALTATLNTALSDLGTPEVVLYNAARVQPSPFPTYAPEDIVEDFKIPNLGLYTTASVVLPHLVKLGKEKPDSHPALFVTSGFIVHQPLAEVFSLSMAKSAQASLVRVLAGMYEGQGVHVGMVTVGGAVGDEEGLVRPGDVAKVFWGMYGQRKGEWEVERRSGW